MSLILPAAHVVVPLEGALHFLLLLVGLFDLVGDPRQELFKIGQEVRLVPPQLSPKASHLLWTGGRRWGGELRLKASGQNSVSCFLNSLLKDVAGPQALQQHTEVPLFLVFNGGQLGLPLALIKGLFDPEGWAGAWIVFREPPATEEVTWNEDASRLQLCLIDKNI